MCYTYDNLSRVTARTVKKLSDNSVVSTETFTYDANGNLIRQSNGIGFVYDASGVCGISHGNSTYFYRKDILGNIVALLNADGEIVAKYTYDAWGNHTITATEGNETIANLNPFRYRGYYYDVETGLYFLKTRYYDPEVGRFITIDDISYLDPDSINGLNLYAYCRNNPVMCVDPNGTFVFTTAMLISMAIGAGFLGALGGITAYQNATTTGKTGWALFEATVSGIFTGAILGAAVGFVASAGTSYLLGGISAIASKLVGDTATSIFTGTNAFGSWESYAIAFVFGGLIKGSSASKLTKMITDVFFRPAADQIVKMGTQGKSFNVENYVYSVWVRGRTYGFNNYSVTTYIWGSEISVCLEKVLLRSFYTAMGKLTF